MEHAKCASSLLLQGMLVAPAFPIVDVTTVRPTHVEPDSLFGMYVRQLLLDCHGLGFEGLSSLFDDLRVYLEGSGDHGSHSMELAPADMGGALTETPSGRPSSSRQVQQYLQVRGEGKRSEEVTLDIPT